MTGSFHPQPVKNNRCGWWLFFCGICMGAADLVPGISGGTIAFILGFYQPLLDSLKTLNGSAFRCLLKGEWHSFIQQVAWKFLLTLLAGIVSAFVCLATLFQWILTHEVYRVYFYATFLGLIFASFVFCMQQIKKWNEKMVIGLCLGILMAHVLTDTTLAPASEGDYAVAVELKTRNLPLRNYNSQDHLLTGLSSQMLSVLLAQGILEETAPVYNQQHMLIGLVGELVLPSQTSFFNGKLVICGALAVCALLLPGISGSYILTLLGVYPIVIEALADFLRSLGHFSFHTEGFVVLWSLGIGIAIGGLVFSRLVSWLLRDYPDLSLAILSGFMIGAIRSVWPFWSYEYILMPLKLYKGPQLVTLHPFFPSWDSPIVWQAFACAVMGFVLIFVFESFSKISHNKV